MISCKLSGTMKTVWCAGDLLNQQDENQYPVHMINLLKKEQSFKN